MRPMVDAPPEREAAALTPFAEPQATADEMAALPASLRLRYAAWLRVSGRHGDAARILDQIEALSGETATLLDERAALALATGDAAAVAAAYERRLAISPAPSARASHARTDRLPA